MLVWQADTATMHPDLDPGTIAAAYADDPVGAATEYGGVSIDLEGYLAREALDAAIVRSRYGCRRCPTCRPSSSPSRGSADSFTLAIAHQACEASHAAGSSWRASENRRTRLGRRDTELSARLRVASA